MHLEEKKFICHANYEITVGKVELEAKIRIELEQLNIEGVIVRRHLIAAI